MKRSAVRIVRDEGEAKLLTDPMRREILRLLAKDSLTENELAEILGLSPPSVGYHLRSLMRKRFISIVRKEPEEHGIIQKFYHTNALIHIIDKSSMPFYIRRYFMPNELERARGVIAGLSSGKGGSSNPTSDFMERLAVSLANALVQIAEKYEGSPATGDPESLISRLYKEAVSEVLRVESRVLG